MMKLRLLPLVLVAAGSLFALKFLGLLTSGGYVLSVPRTAQAQSPAELFTASVNKPADSKGEGEKEGDKPKSDAAPALPLAAPKPQNLLDRDAPVSAAERAILERLQERRQELDGRMRDLEMRESLLKAAEKRLESRLNELKELESKVRTSVDKKDEAEAAKFKALVTMYENMKPKDAAKVFDRLETRVLIDIVAQMNPRKMSDILAQMSAEAAEKFTVETASRSGQDKSPNNSELPKIEGRPSGG